MNGDLLDSLLVKGVSRRGVLAAVHEADNKSAFFWNLAHVITHENGLRAKKAAWVIRHLSENYADTFENTQTDELLSLLSTQSDSSVIRDLIKAVMGLPLNENQQGLLTDICLTRFTNNNYSVAVKYNCLTWMTASCLKWPDLIHETLAAIGSQEGNYTASFDKHLKKMRKRILKFEGKKERLQND